MAAKRLNLDMEASNIFIVDSRCSSQSPNDLAVDIRDVVKISTRKNDEGIIFGECLRSKKSGWFNISCGHWLKFKLISDFNESVDSDEIQFSEMSLTRRKKVFSNIISSEESFILILKEFIDIIIRPLSLKNTPFKREFLSQPSLAVCFTLIQDIFSASTVFVNDIKLANSLPIKIAEIFDNFSPSIQLFAQYVSEISSALNALKKFSKQLSEVLGKHSLPQGLSIESIMILPSEHYSVYRSNLEEFIWLISSKEYCFSSVANALDKIVDQTDAVEDSLADAENSIQLLKLQNMFVGNADVFKLSRKLIRDDQVERIKISDQTVTEVKSFQIHLFNDCVMVSYRNKSVNNPNFKLFKSFDLSSVIISAVTILGDDLSTSFQICNKRDALDVVTLRCNSESMANSWIRDINQSSSNVEEKSKRRMVRKASILDVMPLPKDVLVNMGPRALCIFNFLQSEKKFCRTFSQMNELIFQPLQNSSKGATLVLDNGLGIADSKANTVTSKIQSQIISEALQESDIQVFLRAAEGLATGLAGFIELFDHQCSAAKWTEIITAGSIFASSSVVSLFNQYRSYALGLPATLRVLKGDQFAKFYKDAENIMSRERNTLEEVFELPCLRLTMYLNFIVDLKNLTEEDHRDFPALQTAFEFVETTHRDISDVIKSKKNFEKLMKIQSSFINFGVGQTFLQNLVTTHRTLIKEDELVKVCRKKNKPFRFWLFNDYLMYGSSLGSSTFSFNRAIDLNLCSIRLYSGSDLKHAFEIYGAEKSFIVIAPSSSSQQDWFDSIQGAISALRPAETNSSSLAPLWVPDHDSDACLVCNIRFGWLRRRHHCRKCGGIVCGDHSKKKVILEHIHKSDKYRVCDRCFDSPGNGNAGLLKEESNVKPTNIASPPAAAPPPPLTTSSGDISVSANSSQSSHLSMQSPPSRLASPPPPPSCPPPPPPSYSPIPFQPPSNPLPRPPARPPRQLPSPPTPLANTLSPGRSPPPPPLAPPPPSLHVASLQVEPELSQQPLHSVSLSKLFSNAEEIADSQLVMIPKSTSNFDGLDDGKETSYSVNSEVKTRINIHRNDGDDASLEMESKTLVASFDADNETSHINTTLKSESEFVPGGLVHSRSRPAPPPPPSCSPLPPPPLESIQIDVDIDETPSSNQSRPPPPPPKRTQTPVSPPPPPKKSAIEPEVELKPKPQFSIAMASLHGSEIAREQVVRRTSVLGDIQSGASKLRPVQVKDERMKTDNNPSGNIGMLSTLAIEMFKRRIHVQDEDSDNESSGFSDSSSDSEE